MNDIYRRFISNREIFVIMDYTWYYNNLPEIDEWLNKHNCFRKGMVIEFCDEKTKTMFLLRYE